MQINLKKIKFNRLLLSFLLIILLPSCISIKNPNATKQVAGPMGFFKSTDSGITWEQKSSLMNSEGKPLSIAGLNINKIIFDPLDKNTLYLITNSGLFVSYNEAKEWLQVPKFGSKAISDIAIDYNNKCNIFVAVDQSIFLSKDCARTFEEIYFDKTRPTLKMNVIETDSYVDNRNILYLGNNLGEFLKSTDFGNTWQILRKFNNPIKKITLDKFDTRIVYVATEAAGLFKSTDGGVTWVDKVANTNLNAGLSKYQNWEAFYDLVPDLTQKDTYIWLCKHGLLKTTDGGVTWTRIKLITPTGDAQILSMAIDPQNNQKMYYAIESSFYITNDGGVTWSTQKLPTSGLIKSLAIPPDKPNVLYLGTKVKEKK